jgi:hypothetical protein
VGEGNVVEGGGVNVTRGSWVQAIKFRYDIWHVDVPMNYPSIVANVVALPFNQILQVVPAHARVQYGFHFVLFLAFYKDWWRRGSRATADYRVGGGQSELDDGKDRM